MTRLFDTIVVVEWSARSTPSPARPSPDAVWIATAGAGEGPPRYFRTRAAAMASLAEYLAEALATGRRVLVGFDFPFGYPRGFAAAVTGRSDALALWSCLAERVEDAPDNANNRFRVAAALNAALPGVGPFWGHPAGLDLPDLPDKGAVRAGHGLPERRLVEERVPTAKTCWQLSGNGAVGGQVLTGLPALQRLHSDPRLAGAIAVWPFETGLTPPEAPLVLAEVYPSLLARAAAAARPEGGIRDERQVRVTAAAYAALDADGRLGPLFAAAPGLTPEEAATIAREEAWILGAGHEAPGATRATAGAPPLRNDCFALPPGVAWVPVDDALARLRASIAPVAQVEIVSLDAALGRILAERITAARAHPPFANAAVDGYGFARTALGDGPQALPLVAGRAAAGGPLGDAVPPGRAVRILTGAPLPEGVDTVILEEDTARDGDTVRFSRSPKRGANTRPLGEDVPKGTHILPAGHLVRPQDLGLAASVGLAMLPVRRRLRVGVLSTGDEVRPPGSAAAPHQIFDANRPMLLGLLRRWQLEPVDLGHAPDDAAAVAAALDRGAAGADAILATGGASAGDEDHVSRILRERGSLTTWRIAVKPGRPLALGFWRDTPVFGLPGNPVAAFVCTLIFARPALLALGGAPWLAPRALMLPAAFAKDKKPGRREYLRARPDGSGRVEVFRSEGSGRISGLAWAEGLVELGDGAARIAPGDPVRYLPFSEFGL
jgi:molybdopterin molybdotransferase